MSSFEHVHESYRHILALPKRERIEFVQKERWLGYPVAQRTLERIQELFERPRRPRMTNFLLVGEPNNGKSTLVKRFLETTGKPYETEDNDPVKPVIVVESPPKNGEKDLHLSILNCFHTSYRSTDPVASLRYQVIRTCRACGVRMMIVDEFHSLVSGPKVRQREVMNVIKFLCNSLSIPIVGVGTREAVRALHTDPQHASRFDVLELPLWKLDADFQRMLASIEKALPLKNPSKLSQPELARPLHYISGGNLGDLLRLVAECAEEAIETGSETIDKQLIEKHKWLRPTSGIRERIG